MTVTADGWTDVGAATALAGDGRLDAEIDGSFIAVVQLQGALHAFEDRCTHDGEPLAGAEIEADATTPCGVVVCPRHGARFCLATGAALSCSTRRFDDHRLGRHRRVAQEPRQPDLPRTRPSEPTNAKASPTRLHQAGVQKGPPFSRRRSPNRPSP